MSDLDVCPVTHLCCPHPRDCTDLQCILDGSRKPIGRSELTEQQLNQLQVDDWRPSIVVGERRVWPPQTKIVTAEGEVLGWVFVLPDKPGRLFAISYASWVELEAAPPRALTSGSGRGTASVGDG